MLELNTARGVRQGAAVRRGPAPPPAPGFALALQKADPTPTPNAQRSTEMAPPEKATPKAWTDDKKVQPRVYADSHRSDRSDDRIARTADTKYADQTPQPQDGSETAQEAKTESGLSQDGGAGPRRGPDGDTGVSQEMDKTASSETSSAGHSAALLLPVIDVAVQTPLAAQLVASTQLPITTPPDATALAAAAAPQAAKGIAAAKLGVAIDAATKEGASTAQTGALEGESLLQSATPLLAAAVKALGGKDLGSKADTAEGKTAGTEQATTNGVDAKSAKPGDAVKSDFAVTLAQAFAKTEGADAAQSSVLAAPGQVQAREIVQSSAPQTSAPLARADQPVPLQALAVEVGMRAMRGSKEFQIRLDPEDLGRIDVRLEIDETGGVQAKLVVERVETLHMLQRDAKTLERAFDQAGLKTNPDGLQFSLKSDSQQGGGQQGNQDGPNKSSRMVVEATPEAFDTRTLAYRIPGMGAVDISI
jgi:flagellar hook-length control protein FliK